MQTHPVYVRSDAPDGSMVQIGQVSYPQPPEGFELGRHNTLTWLTPETRILAALQKGTTVLTGGWKVRTFYEGKDIDACQFDQKVGKAPLVVRASDKPALQAALDWQSGLRKAQEAVQSEYWANKHRGKLDTQRAQVPAGHVFLELVGSKADGAIEEYRLDSGEVLENPETVGGPGPWRYATPAQVETALGKLAQRRQDEAAAREAQDTRRAAGEAALKATAVPAHAVSAYDRFSGDRERAWDAGAEMEAMMIERYGAAIEAQNLSKVVPPVPRVAELLPPGA